MYEFGQDEVNCDLCPQDTGTESNSKQIRILRHKILQFTQQSIFVCILLLFALTLLSASYVLEIYVNNSNLTLSQAILVSRTVVSYPCSSPYAFQDVTHLTILKPA
jgi:hypothetical protein